MKNIMVCVTQQKTCERLIKYGYEFLQANTADDDDENELFIIHVAHSQFNFLGNSKEGVALEYLYQNALEYGANLTVVRSDDVLATLCELINKNKITHVVLGTSGNNQSNNNMVKKLEKSIGEKVEILTIS